MEGFGTVTVTSSPAVLKWIISGSGYSPGSTVGLTNTVVTYAKV